jgi:hypothetical protein
MTEAHASYRAYLKVQTIDGWLAERGTANALSNLGLHESFLTPLCCFVYLQLRDPAPNSAPAAVRTRGYDWHVLMKSSMRQSHRRHRICQTLIVVHVLSVPGWSYCLCTVLLGLPDVERSTARPGVRQSKARLHLSSWQ